MTSHIIIQVVLAIIFAGGIAGVIKLPGKQKAIAVFVMLIAIISTVLLWCIK
jgi:uncharacterized membrane protein